MIKVLTLYKRYLIKEMLKKSKRFLKGVFKPLINKGTSFTTPLPRQTHQAITTGIHVN